MSTADPQRACGGKNNGYLSTLVNYQHICLRLSPLGCLTAQHTKYIKLTYICSTWPYWICWHHLNTNCHAMHDNSCSDKAHKAVFAAFAPAFLYVCLYDSLSQQVCARSCRVHGDVYLWVPQPGMLDHLVGKWDYSYLLLCGLLSAKPLILQLRVSSLRTQAVCNFVMQTDPSKQLVMWQQRNDDEMFGVFSSVISSVFWLDAEFYYYLYKSDNFSVTNLMAFCFGVFVGRQLQLRAALHHLPKFRIMTQLCVSPTCRAASKKSTTFQFIILIHKQSLMFMAGVVTCLWQHYVCFTTPLSSQV